MIWRSTSHSSHLYFLVCRKFSLLRVFFKRIVICLTKTFESKYERGKPTNAFWGLEASVLRCSCFLKNLEIGFLWKLSKFLSVSSKFWMWELDYKEGWVPKNWCFWTVVLEKTLESPLNSKEIKPVNPKGNQSWIFIGRTGLIFLLSKELSRIFSSTTIWKHQFFSAQPLYGPTLTSIHDYWKNHSFAEAL